MKSFLIALVGGGFGVLLASVFMSSARLRRGRRESLAIAASAVVGAGLAGLVGGAGGSGLLTGLGMAIAFILVPVAVLAVRDARGPAHDRGA